MSDKEQNGWFGPVSAFFAAISFLVFLTMPFWYGERVVINIPIWSGYVELVSIIVGLIGIIVSLSILVNFFKDGGR